jgi:hypothetical protein
LGVSEAFKLCVDRGLALSKLLVDIGLNESESSSGAGFGVGSSCRVDVEIVTGFKCFWSAAGDIEGVFAARVEGETENDISASEDGARRGDGATNLFFSTSLLELLAALKVPCLGLSEHGPCDNGAENGVLTFVVF